MTQVTLGNFFTTSNGKNVLGGAGGSGLDTQSIINSLVAVKSQPATNDQTEITANGQVTTALNSFQSLLTTFQTAAQALSNPPGVDNDANNVFDFTTGSVGNGGSNYVSVTTTPGAALQTYNVSDISQLATAGSQGTATYTVASADAPIVSASTISGTSHQFAPGTITVNGSAITFNEGDSLNDVAADFNAVSSTTGISATVIQQSSGNYQLSFASTATGSANSFDLTSSNTVSDPDGVLTNAGIGAATAGQDAKFDLNGVPLTRSSNTVSDAVTGLTFNLLQTTPDSTTEYPVTVSADTTTIQNSIVNFVNAYNAIQTFAAQQTQLNSDGTYASTSVLANNQTFRQTMADIDQEVTSQVNGLSGTAASSLSDVGITFTTQAATSTAPEVQNILTVNDGQLTTALASNFTAVTNLFGFNLTSNNPNLAVYTATNSLAVSNFTLDIDPTNNVFTASYTDSTGSHIVNLTATPVGNGIPGYTLTGPSGSDLDGLELIYGSDSAANINVTTTQGIAAQAYNTSNTATTANTGTIAVALTGLQTQDTTLNQNITQVNTQVSQYQTMLLAKFAALESAVSSVNTLLDSLSANANAQLEASQ